MYLGTILSVFFALFVTVLESLIPIVKDELDIRRYVYRIRYPERRLPYNTRIPFIDESESWAYEIIYVFQLYVLVYFTQDISSLIMAIVVTNIILYSLCLYQLVVSTTHMSPLRYFKFAAEFLSFLVEFFIICNSSEVADDCSIMIVYAIKNSNWEKCSNQTKRDLCVILRRAQKPNHARFHRGALVVSRVLFMKVIRTAYSFVNFMRCMR
ncbi:hypothetical protein WDU94_011623 [Cyamophila willieti]